MEERICAGIVTYNPDINRLQENISGIIKQVERVVLCDNGSENFIEIKELLSKYKDTYIIQQNTNMGIAYALNQLCEYSINEGYHWILTLDQDSVSPDDLIEKLVRHSDYNKTAIISPRIIYRNNEAFSTVYSDDAYEVVDWTITSASLTNLAIWKELEGFDEKLFIDKVDYDYCIRARKKGFEVVRVNTTSLMHELGKLHCKKLLGRTVYITNHSPIRYYYMSRNAIILKKKLNTGVPFAEIMKLICKVSFYEENKIKKIVAVIKGIIDARKYER